MGNFSVYLKITNRCNLRCSHCYIKNYSGDMPFDIVEQVAMKFRHDAIIFHGGEPTLTGLDYLQTVIDILGSRRYLMQSNLVEIDRGLPVLLSQYFESRIGTSYDWHRREHLAPIIKSVDFLSSKDIAVTALITVTPDLTIGDIEDFVERFEKAGGKSFRFQSLTPVKTAPLKMDHYLDVSKYFLEHPLNDSAMQIRDAMCGGIQGINGGNCGGKVRTVNPDGMVYVCPEFAGQELFPLDHISTLDTHLGNSFFRRREKHLALQCCEEYWQMCRGGCISNAFFHSKNFGADPYCSFYKEFFEYVRNHASQ